MTRSSERPLFEDSNMPEITIAKSLSIREAGLDEYWLQDMICETPTCLGLGDLQMMQKERRQTSGGRLDILLKDPEDDAMYEVEVMLGETDESHIIRTIEYWDNEKRRWPQRQHFAVLVAENINRRFFNVVYLLGNVVPIIAIQATLIESEGRKSLFFTPILNIYEELEDGTSVEDRNYDRNYWTQKAHWVVEDADTLFPIVKNYFQATSIKFLQQYISISSDGINRFWFIKRANGKTLLKVKIAPSFHDEVEILLDNAGIGFVTKNDSFRLTINRRTIESKLAVFESLIDFSKRSEDF